MNMSENQIVVYQPNETVRLDVRLENETVWLNRHQMAQLFGRDVKTIGKHIASALSEELSQNPVVADFATTQAHANATVQKIRTVQKKIRQLSQNLRQLPRMGKSIRSNITVWM